MPAVAPVKALYYPHIQFGSVGWLRAALLYWEGILRLVPDGFTPFDPPEVHELVSAGLIEDVSPGRYRRAVADALGPQIEKMPPREGNMPCLDASADPLVHVSKFEPNLLQNLKRRGLAAAGGEWVKLSPEMATMYKVILANAAGRELNAAPATDDTVCGAPVYFAYRKLVVDPARRAPPDGFSCARLIAPFPAIERAGSLTTEMLLKIRENTSTQRRIFRDTIQERVAQLADLPSEEAIVSHLEDFKSEIRTEINEQRGAHRASSLRDAWRLILISAPASVGTAVAVAGAMPLVAAAGVVGSIGLGVADFMAHAAQRRRAGHYLLVLESAFAARYHGIPIPALAPNARSPRPNDANAAGRPPAA
jgi:hypothetical protein